MRANPGRPAHTLVLVSAVVAGCLAAVPRAAPAGNVRYPSIASVAPTVLHPTRPGDTSPSLVVRGTGFGRLRPYNGDGRYIYVVDESNPHGPWTEGCNGRNPCGKVQSDNPKRGPDTVTLQVTKWTDTEIDIRRFAGSFGGTRALASGDYIGIWIWNPSAPDGPHDWDPAGYVGLKVSGRSVVPQISVNQVAYQNAPPPSGPQTVTVVITKPHASVTFAIQFTNGRRMTRGPVSADADGKAAYSFVVPVPDQGLTEAVVVVAGHSASTWFEVPERSIPITAG
jgi:hypothetical protein